MIDKLYTGANELLCSSQCMCNAGKFKIITENFYLVRPIYIFVTLIRPQTLGQTHEAQNNLCRQRRNRPEEEISGGKCGHIEPYKCSGGPRKHDFEAH